MSKTSNVYRQLTANQHCPPALNNDITTLSNRDTFFWLFYSYILGQVRNSVSLLRDTHTMTKRELIN